MLESFVVLVSGPDCFSRASVLLDVNFHCFMGPTRLKRTMAVLHMLSFQSVLYDPTLFTLYVIKFLKNTFPVYNNQPDRHSHMLTQVLCSAVQLGAAMHIHTDGN